MKAAIKAIRSYLPETILSNEHLSSEFPEWNVEKIYSKTGIGERHIAKEGECASDLGYFAAKRLFADKVVEPEDIDFLILCTQSPDYFLPTSACLLQSRLGLRKSTGAFDYNLGCSGFVYGLALSKSLIESGIAKNVLLIMAETYSKHLSPSDKTVRTIFGDGASAVLVQAQDVSEEAIGPFVFGTDGAGAKNLIVENGGFRNPTNTSTLNSLYMNGPEIFSFTMRGVPECLRRLLDLSQLNIENIDQFFLHQANKFMLEALRVKMKVPEEKFCINMEKYGNTVSATIPMAIETFVNKNPDAALQRSMLIGFGVGYSWASCLVDLSCLDQRSVSSFL